MAILSATPVIHEGGANEVDGGVLERAFPDRVELLRALAVHVGLRVDRGRSETHIGVLPQAFGKQNQQGHGVQGCEVCDAAKARRR